MNDVMTGKFPCPFTDYTNCLFLSSTSFVPLRRSANSVLDIVHKKYRDFLIFMCYNTKTEKKASRLLSLA